ncbi:MAG: HAD family hydrolase [Alphaproteobacteria bacterium]|nr:HAD family hydrolase [Alphaproteobacteria bacterium]
MNKRLIILDLDNTMIDTLHVWGTSLAKLLEGLSNGLSLSKKTLHDLVRRTHGQYRFNDGVSLIDWMFEDGQGLKSSRLASNWQLVARNVQEEWMRQSAALSTPYDGMIPMLQQWRDDGCKIAIQTDAESCAVLRRLWWIAVHAARRGELDQPDNILDLIDGIYCQPSIPHSALYLAEIEPEFRREIEEKLHIWQDKIFKPSSAHLIKILGDQNVTPDQTLYIGDGHKDGAEAKSLSVAFAWARYGAKVAPEVLALYALVGSRNYSYGERTVLDAMDQMGIIPDYVFQEGLSEKRCP